MTKIASYREFWPYYLEQHKHPVCRSLHFVGTTALVGLLEEGLRNDRFWYFLLGMIVAYGFAWTGHFFFEKNRPATFTYPLWSLRADLQMVGGMWYSLLARRRLP